MAITEEEFLSGYSLEKYDRPSVTADVVAFAIRAEEKDSYRHNPKNNLSILLAKRGEHPFKNSWALPGGFLGSEETLEECAFREIKEETNVVPAALMHFGVFSKPKRDPRGRIISNGFLSIISEEDVKAMSGGDVIDAQWFDVTFDKNSEGEYELCLKGNEEELKAVVKEISNSFKGAEYEILDGGQLAFDHAKIIATAIAVLRKNAENFEFLFDFMPEKFTLTAIQRVQETILDTTLLPAGFRRKIADYVVETDEYTAGAGHRPAKLFVRKERMD